MTRHFNGPLLADRHWGAGIFKDLPSGALNDEDWSVYSNDFLTAADYDDTNDWTLTQITSGSASILTPSVTGIGLGGILRVTTAANDQGPIIQLDGGGVGLFPDSLGLVFGDNARMEGLFLARFSLTDPDNSDVFVGMAEDTSDSAVLTSAGALTSDTHAGFHLLNADNGSFRASVAGDDDGNDSTIENAFTVDNGEYITVAVRMVMTGEGSHWAEFAYRFEGDFANARRNQRWASLGQLTPTDNWDAVLYPTVAFVGGSGSGDHLELDKIVLAVRRDATADAR